MDNQWESNYKTPKESPGFLLWQVTNHWQRQIRTALKEVDLTHVQFVLLAACSWLNHQEKPVTQTFLSQFTHTDVMMTSQVVRTLEKKGLLKRTPHPTDTRANQLHVTPEGEMIRKQAIQLVENTDAKFFSFSDEDLEHFMQHLNRLL